MTAGSTKDQAVDETVEKVDDLEEEGEDVPKDGNEGEDA